jgi:hypothetical protein
MLFALLLPAGLFGHMVSMSTGELRVDGNHARYELRIPTYEAAHVQNPQRALLDHIQFTSGGKRGRQSAAACNERQGTYICTADYEFPNNVDELGIECTFASITVPNHVHMLRAYRGDKIDQAVFDLSFTTAQIRFRPPAFWEIVIHESGAGFLRAVGGLAPLLFLLSLVLAARGSRELTLLTIAFVFGETIACGVVPRLNLPLSPRFIEAAAALTIAYLAFEIVLLPDSGQRWLVVGVLGLIHGTYFSLFLTSSGYQAWLFLTGVVLAEVLVIAGFAFGMKRLLLLLRVPRAVPLAASVLLTVSVVWFFVRLRG